MRTRTKIILIVAVVLLFIQLPFFQPQKNYSEIIESTDITDVYEVPMNVQMNLYDACYDCHSNNSKAYPWYSNIQPVSWWMDLHIQKGKEAVNFSEFANYSLEEREKKFQNIANVMKEHSMPLKSYLWMHNEAKLSDRDYQNVKDWALQELNN